MEKTDIKSMTLNELTEYIVNNGYPKFRGKQLYEWMHVKLCRSVEEMTNIPKELKKHITDNCEFWLFTKVFSNISNSFFYS